MGERHLEVRVGNVETATGGRQVFGAGVRADTDIKALICRNLDAVGRTEDTILTAFTDGCPGLRGILSDAGVTQSPMLDWFHVAMRLDHLKQVAGALLTDDTARTTAKAVIVDEVERLRWRLWNGQATNARISIDRIRVVMHHFKGERGERKRATPSGKLWTALHALDKYLSGQSDWLVNYAERYRAGLRVGTALTEGTANFLVNRRMNKIQQMRWSRRGADLLLQPSQPVTQKWVLAATRVAADSFQDVVGLKIERARQVVGARFFQRVERRGCPNEDIGVPDGRHAEFRVGEDVHIDAAIRAHIADGLQALALERG